MKNYDVNQEIEKYYRLSIFINKYILLLWSLLLSFILMLTFNVKDNSVLAYSNSDILTKTLNKNKLVVWNDTSIFNTKSEYIKAKLSFTESEYEKWNLKLWIWIFKDKYGIYYPMNVYVDSNNITTKLKTKKDIIKNYVSILSTLKTWKDKFIKPILKTIPDEDVVKKYNLWCMDTYLGSSLFCNLNKDNLINDLINKKWFDISKKFYTKLFSKLEFSKEKKCSILTQIYNSKYNFSSIKEILDINSCNITQFKEADEFIEKLLKDKQIIFKVWDKLPFFYDVLVQKLTQQFYYIIVQDNVPSYMIYSNIKLLKKMLSNGQMDSTLATLSVNVLNHLMKKKSFNRKADRESLISAIISLRKWDELQRWLDSYITDKELTKSSESSDENLIVTHNNVMSVREKINTIFTSIYKNVFSITKKISYNSNTRIAHIEWIIKLKFKEYNRYKMIPLKISFDIKDIIWTNFAIHNLKIFNKKISNYINENDIKINHDSFLDLKHSLEDKLYAPLVKKDYWQNKLSVCNKLKILDNSMQCSNWVVSILVRIPGLYPPVSVQFKLNSDLSIKEIKFNNYKFKYDLKNLLKEKITIDLTELVDKLNKLAKEKNYNYKYMPYLTKIVKNNIKLILKNKKIKLSWLSITQQLELNKKFKRFLWINIELIRVLKWYYRIFFNLQWNTFWVLYDKKNNIIKWIVIYLPKKKKQFLFNNINMKLSTLSQEDLNSFKLQPLEFLKEKNSIKYKEYEQYINKK